MTHDPRCYRSHDKPLGRDPFCQCDLIAKVREDERSSNFTPDDFSDEVALVIAAAVQRVEALRDMGDAGWTHLNLVNRADVITTIKGAHGD